MKWTLENALPVTREISVISDKHGFLVALYGSVLVKGESNSDLDLYFVNKERATMDHAKACLIELSKALSVMCTPLSPQSTSRIQFQDGRHIDAQFIELTPLA